MNARMILMWIICGDSSSPYTVPIFCDNSAAVLITANDRPSKRTRHIERRWLYSRRMYQGGFAVYKHVNGDALMLADPLTKNKSSYDEAVKFKYSLFMSDPPSSASPMIQTSAQAMFTLKRGDGTPALRSLELPASSPHSGEAAPSGSATWRTTISRACMREPTTASFEKPGTTSTKQDPDQGS